MTLPDADRSLDHRRAVETLASERYILNEMSAAERDAFEAHYFSCADCADEVRADAVMRDGVGAGLLHSRAEPRWFSSPVLPWALAATLAVVAGYQTVWRPAAGVPGQTVALAPMTLRAASRGAEPAVTIGPSGILTLAVDLGDRPFRRVSYTLRTAAGSTIASGEAAPPPAGAPLMLIVPGANIQPGEHYVLVVQDPVNADLTGEEYRFRVDSL
jgi:hypothetical protein